MIVIIILLGALIITCASITWLFLICQRSINETLLASNSEVYDDISKFNVNLLETGAFIYNSDDIIVKSQRVVSFPIEETDIFNLVGYQYKERLSKSIHV